MKIRLIIQSTESGESEFVEFTDDLKGNVENFLYPEHSVDYDEVIEMDEVGIFPINSSLKRT